LPSKDDQQVRGIERQKLENLARVRGFADHIQGFRDLTPRVRGLIALADVLWKHDESYARKLFTRAYDAARPAEADPTSNDTAERGSSSNPDSASQDSGWLRCEVASRIARHDAAWARDLTNREAAASKRGVAIGMAWDLLQDDPKQAAQYLEMALDPVDSPEIAYLLGTLRGKDPTASDQLFLKLLQGLSAQTVVDPYELLAAGGYVLLPDQSEDVVELMGRPVFNSSQVIPLASQNAIRGYFDAAAGILSRPISPSLTPGGVTYFKDSNYVVACLLLPGARQFAPEKAPLLEAVIRNLAPEIPPDLTEQAIRGKLDAGRAPTVNTLEDARRELDNILDDDRHDSSCIHLSYNFLHKDDFKAAKAIAGEVRDLGTRDKLKVLLGLEEGVRFLERGKLNDAASVATRLSPGIERAILWLAIAHKQLEGGNAKLAATTFTWSLAEANRLQDPRRAVLILRASADLTRVDPLLASQALNEAIRTFNRVSPYVPLRMEWLETVVVGVWADDPNAPRPHAIGLSLQTAGLDFQLAHMLAPLAKIDMEGTIFEVMSLEDEEARGQGLAALASFILERKTTDIRSEAASNQREKE
jgi:hypothetical protein